MKPSGPLKRFTPLKRTSTLQRGGWRPKQRPRDAKVKPRADGQGRDFSQRTKTRAASHAGFRCRLGLPGCRGHIEEFHHRKKRSQGGDGQLENCLPLCGYCHHVIHRVEVDWAYRHGLLVRRNADPARIGAYTACDVDCPVDHLASFDIQPLWAG